MVDATRLFLSHKAHHANHSEQVCRVAAGVAQPPVRRCFEVPNSLRITMLGLQRNLVLGFDWGFDKLLFNHLRLPGKLS